MTDEKKAEDYAKGKAHEHYHFLFEENNGSPVDFAKLCYLDGLTEGRKEKYEMALSQIRRDREKVVEYNEILIKENAELKAKLPHWEDAKTSPTEHGWYLVYAYGEDQEEEPGVGMGYWDGTEWKAELDLEITVLQWTHIPKPEVTK